jgi:PAS domain S-box-containing protein
MNDRTDHSDLDQLIDAIAKDRIRRSARPLIARLAAVMAALLLAASLALWFLVEDRRAALENDLRVRAEFIAQTQADALRAAFDATARSAARIAQADLFRLFVAEADLAGQGQIPGGSLGGQIPYMNEVLSEFVRQNRLSGAYVMTREERAILASGAAPEIQPEHRVLVRRVFERKARQFGPLRASMAGFLLDVLLPIAPAQNDGEVAGVLLFAVPIGATLADAVAPKPLGGAGERVRLLELLQGEAVEIVPSAPAQRRTVGLPPDLRGGSGLPFGRRPAVGGGAGVYSAGVTVADTGLVVLYELDGAIAHAPLARFIVTSIAFYVLVLALVSAILVALGWRQAGDHAADLAEQYQSLAGRINAQRRLLGGILGTVGEFVGLRRPDGQYVFANDALARSVGRKREELGGLTDAELFGRGTGERLQRLDRAVIEQGAAAGAEEELQIGGARRVVQFANVPYRNDAGAVIGVLSVGRDVTDLREAETRRRRAEQQLIAVLVNTVEQVDPYLSGHSRLMRGLAALTARRLGLSADEVAGIEIAANLSQIGKIALPREIVAANRRLTGDELKIMQTHIERAVEILRPFEFDIPVLRCVSEIHERLDGSGYPKGLRGSELSLSGRVLAVADVFSARIAPRSYRGVISPEEALRILGQHPEKYDAAVVQALRQSLHTIEGERLLASLPGQKP